MSRADQDALAAESHRRAAAAQAAGYFAEQILPVEIAGKRGKTTIVDTDEHVRPEVSLEDMAKLRPAFAKDGTVTAGNASGVNDAAAAVVLASESFVREQRPAPRWPGWSGTRTRASSRGSWAWARCRRSASCWTGPA